MSRSDQTIRTGDADRLNRRAFVHSSFGLGSLALSSLLPEELGAGSHGIGNGGLHHKPTAKRVIFLHQSGAPSQMDLFDPKPDLESKWHGKEIPDFIRKGQRLTGMTKDQESLPVTASFFGFMPHGKSGTQVSELLPHTAKVVDRLCMIRSMYTHAINHDPAITYIQTGSEQPGRPSMGAWVTYGLGSEADDLPGFVVMTSKMGRNPQPIAARQWHSGFLPGQFQGVEFATSGSPVHYVANPPGVSAAHQRDLIETVAALEHHRLQRLSDPEVATRIRQYELAFRMQTSVPQLADLSGETAESLALYGAEPGRATVGTNCLMARRLVERGVRFVHLYHSDWDHHGGIEPYMDEICPPTDRAAAGLLIDLERRGLLDDTLVVIGGEFGRTPMAQSKDKGAGRDHHIKGFSMALAGGGIRGGVAYGETDEFGYHAVTDIVHVRDLHATMLHQLGIDHRRLAVNFQGLDMRLTGVEKSRVLTDILA